MQAERLNFECPALQKAQLAAQAGHLTVKSPDECRTNTRRGLGLCASGKRALLPNKIGTKNSASVKLNTSQTVQVHA